MRAVAGVFDEGCNRDVSPFSFAAGEGAGA